MAVTSSSPADSFSRNADAPAFDACAARAASLCIVSTTTLLSMRSAFSLTSTSSPLKPGIDRSVTITSGLQPPRRLEQLLAVADGADDVEVVLLEQADQAFHDDRVIVGDENGGASRWWHKYLLPGGAIILP